MKHGNNWMVNWENDKNFHTRTGVSEERRLRKTGHNIADFTREKKDAKSPAVTAWVAREKFTA